MAQLQQKRRFAQQNYSGVVVTSIKPKPWHVFLAEGVAGDLLLTPEESEMLAGHRAEAARRNRGRQRDFIGAPPRRRGTNFVAEVPVDASLAVFGDRVIVASAEAPPMLILDGEAVPLPLDFNDPWGRIRTRRDDTN